MIERMGRRERVSRNRHECSAGRAGEEREEGREQEEGRRERVGGTTSASRHVVSDTHTLYNILHVYVVRSAGRDGEEREEGGEKEVREGGKG